MALTSPPPAVQALADMLGACAGWTALSGEIWYPSVPLGDSVGAETTAFIVIEEPEYLPRAMAPGIFIDGGRVEAQLFVYSANAAAIEQTARTIANQLKTQVAGLPIREVLTGMAGEPTAPELAGATSLWQITISVTYGLTF